MPATKHSHDLEERVTRIESAVETVREYLAEDRRVREIEKDQTASYRVEQEKQFKEISNKIGERGRFTLGSAAMAIAVAVPICGLMWFLVTTQVDGRANELSGKIEANANVVSASLASLQSRASVSETERHKLNEMVSKNSELIASVDQKLMVNGAAMTEKITSLEIQDRAIAQFANLRAIQQHQMNGIIWHKLMGYPLPDGFTPTDVSHNKESSR